MTHQSKPAGIDVNQHNRDSWDRNVRRGCRWSIPVDRAEIGAARRGKWKMFLSPTRAIPSSWLGDIPGRSVLCLAGGGAQQGPIVAAAGAEVVVLDQSPAQLEVDRLVSQRDGLNLRLVEGSMDDLSMFAAASFDLIVNRVSNCYVPDVRPVWREAHRALGAKCWRPF